MDSDTKMSTASMRRLILCTCIACRTEDPAGVGLLKAKWEEKVHKKTEVLGSTAFAQRGRSRPLHGQPSRAAKAPRTSANSSARPTNARSLSPDRQVGSSSRVQSDTLIQPDNSQELDQVPMDVDTLQEEPDRDRRIHQNFIHADHDSPIFFSNDTPDLIPKLAPPAYAPLPDSTRNIPIVMNSGIAIPLAHSLPATMRTLTTFPDNNRHPLPPINLVVPALRRSTRDRVVRVRKSVETLTETVAVVPTPPRRGAVASDDDVGGVLGLYDDPDDLDELQQEIVGIEARLRSEHGSNEVDERLAPPVDIPLVEPRSTAQDVYNAVHDFWFVRLSELVVGFMHVKHRLSFSACALLLFTFGALFHGLGVLPADVGMSKTLKTVLKGFELEDRFVTYPACTDCHRLFSPDVPINSSCPDCDNELFRPVTSSLWKRLTRCRPLPPPPRMAAPIATLSSLLVDFLNEPGIEENVELWKTADDAGGAFRGISDGKVWRNLPGPAGGLFFDPDDDTGELRLGVMFGLDWFRRKDSVYGPSHSSGVMSFTVSNLTPERRYRTQNLLIAGMTPGPKEPTAQQLQPYLKILVDDLIKLYEDGVCIPTPSHPEGRLVRVVLLAIVCDHPAMCKVGGFADHAHKSAPCHKCKVPSAELYSDKSLSNGYEPRDGKEHRKRCFEYRDLPDAEKDNYFKDHGVCWTELARLSYLDLVRCAVIDPMHNMLLGVVKTQWYGQWIQNKALRASTQKKTRELDLIHRFLDSFESPAWVGKLPARMGEPAGGSLSSDEYKVATVTILPMIVPLIWDSFLDESKKDFVAETQHFQEARKKFEGDLVAWETRQEELAVSGTQGAQSRKKPTNKPQPPKEPRYRMQEEEPVNFLRLATSLKIFLGRSIEERVIPRALSLLQDYLMEFRALYGIEAMKPNHHWAVHLPDQIRDFGPVYEFWTFLTERLNKVLKTFNSNNWTGGQVEISMMRAFGRSTHLMTIVKSVAMNPENKYVAAVALRMMANDKEAGGTVSDATNDVAGTDALSQLHVQQGPVAQAASTLSNRARKALHQYYNTDGARVRFLLEEDADTRLPKFIDSAQFYEYALLDGRRIQPTTRTLRNSARSSIVKVIIGGKVYGGEVEAIFHHSQPGIHDNTLFAEIQWLKPLDLTPSTEGDPFSDFPELEIQCWALGQYGTRDEPGVPPAVIPFSLIRCQLSRGLIDMTEPSMWVTTTMERHSIAYETFD